MSICDKCKRSADESCIERFLDDSECPAFIPFVSNGDRIRAMDDETLAAFLFKCMHTMKKAVNVTEVVEHLRQPVTGSPAPNAAMETLVMKNGSIKKRREKSDLRRKWTIPAVC